MPKIKTNPTCTKRKKERNKQTKPTITSSQTNQTFRKKCLNVSPICYTKGSDDPFILTQILLSNIVEQNEIVDITWDYGENTTKKLFLSVALPKMHHLTYQLVQSNMCLSGSLHHSRNACKGKKTYCQEILIFSLHVFFHMKLNFYSLMLQER